MEPSRRPMTRVEVSAAWIVAVGLLLTLGARWVVVTSDETTLLLERRQMVDRVLDRAVEDFRDLQRNLLETGSSLANDPAVESAFRSLSMQGRRSVEEVIQVAADLELENLVAAEFYEPTPRLLAWNGFAMPMDPGPADERFLSETFHELAFDTDRRAALVVWVPIRDGSRVVGAVRAMRLISAKYPVRNEYLRDESLADDWRRATGFNFVIHLGPGEAPFDPSIPTRRLESPDGRVFATVGVDEPTLGETAQRISERYDAVVAFWAAMAALLGLTWAARYATNVATGPIPAVLMTVAAAATGRAVLLVLGVPGRWQGGKAPLAPLFDPEHLASSWGGGAFGSIGDLMVTALFLMYIAVTLATRVARAGSHPRPAMAPGRLIVRSGVGSAWSAILFFGVESVTQQLLDDSTLGYFERSGLLPQRLVVVVFASLLVLLLTAWIAGAASWRSLVGDSSPRSSGLPAGRTVSLLVLGATPVWALALLVEPLRDAGLFIGLILFTIGSAASGLVPYDPFRRPLEYLTARGVLSAVVVLSLILYPALDRGLEKERRDRMVDAASSFSEDRDPRVIFALGQALAEIEARLKPFPVIAPGRVDSLLESVLRHSLVASLGTYEVSASVLGPDQSVVGRSGLSRTPAALAILAARDLDDLDLLTSPAFGPSNGSYVVEKLTSARERDRFDYVGLAVIEQPGATLHLLVRAAQNEHLPAGNTPFPRVLVPAGYYGSLYQDLSIAEFRDDVLVRSFGQEFGRSYLDREVLADLARAGRVWRTEVVGDREYLTHYSQRDDEPTTSPVQSARTIAVRQPAVSLFDRLYYLLRLTVSGLMLGVPIYFVGLAGRRRAGLLPSVRVRFRDKVLNAFFAVGLIAVLAMGALGLRVVTGENDRAIESWLKQHLERVEESLVQESGLDELPYRVLERVEIDSLAARVGLDLTVYRGFELETSSRPQLARDRLIPTRLPIEAYQALFVDGFRFVDVEERLGQFEYTAGYRALTDEQGVPRYIVSVPTLPEQERIEEERARTVAYLFGALLLLVLVVMVTAAVIANALSLPLVRLRKGLERVAEGRFESIRPLESRDEMGELVATFNTMQEQLADSRRLLAQQERQLAWREMARQVAHEIKNSLTPMKLTIQHLRRAHEREADGGDFSELFERKTATLIDQSDALARIANEFSSFARMPALVLESLDLNRVASAAVLLMQEQTRAHIALLLHPGELRVEADREALQRVFINFIKNAVEALDHERQGELRVSTRAVIDEDSGQAFAYAEVVDNGAGVTPDVRDRIFTPAFSTKTSGTGLGLAIARSTIEELHGQIGFESEVGEGSTFWFRIPIHAVGLPEAGR